jgi:hypothetical protein
MALANSIIFVRFIAAREVLADNGKPSFMSASVAFVGDLAGRFPERNHMASWTLDGSDAVETFTQAVLKSLAKEKSPLKVKFVKKLTRKDERTGKQVSDPRWVVEGDGVLMLGIQLSVEPFAKAPQRGYHRNTVSLSGKLVSVKVQPKAEPNGIAL